MSRKHKRHKLSSPWSPYGEGYVSDYRPVPSHIDMGCGEEQKPIRPADLERLATAPVTDADDWGTIE